MLNLIKVPSYTHGEWPQREEAMRASYTHGELPQHEEARRASYTRGE